MRISDVVLEGGDGGFRASALIESPHGPKGRLWYEATGDPARPAPEMAASAFVAACLPTAVWWEDDLFVEPPIDADFLKRLPRIARGHARLHGRRKATVVHATGVSSEPLPDRVVGASFTGGVDSFYTLRQNLDPGGLTPIRALVTGLGLDLKVDDVEQHAVLLQRLGTVAQEYGLDHYAVRTNFRAFFDPYCDPTLVTQGSCLVAFAFLLSGSLTTYLIPATYPIDRLGPYSSHALLDNAWISRPTATVCDGWDMARSDKLTTLVDWPPAMRELHVCFAKRGASNCGRCEKCLRTMALLALHGIVESPAFPSPLGADAIRRLRVREPKILYLWSVIRDEARKSPETRWLADAVAFMILRMRILTPLRRRREREKARRRWPLRRHD